MTASRKAVPALLAFSLCCAVLADTAGEVRRLRYECVRAEEPPVIDGLLEDACWSRIASAEVAHPMVIHNPGRREVRFRLTWDDVYLYFAAEVRDSTPCQRYTGRDDPVWDDDCFELYFNPEDSGGRYYELDFNSAGAIWDSLWLRHHDGRMQTLRGWTAASAECRSRAAEGGWTLEGRLRWDEFVGANHVPPLHGDVWRFNANYCDTPEEGGRQSLFTWSPTDEFGNVDRFGELLFLDPVGVRKREDRRRAAERFLGRDIAAAEPLTNRVELVTVHTPAGAVFVKSEGELDWRVPGTFGRFSVREADADGPVAAFRAQPVGKTDPTVIEWPAWRAGRLVVLSRLAEWAVRFIDTGLADGTWVSIELDGSAARTLRVLDAEWQAVSVPVHEGQAVRLRIDAGPAANMTADSVVLAVYIANQEGGTPAADPPGGGRGPESSPNASRATSPKWPSMSHAGLPTVAAAAKAGRPALLAMGDARPVLPEGWHAFGGGGQVALGEARSGSQRASIRVRASDRFSGFDRFVRHRTGTKLYRISGWMKTELAGTATAQFGIDYLREDGALERQATTRYKMEDTLRWGLCSANGRTEWTRYVAHAYDVPPETVRLRVWCGVNPWETPEAEGTAWFSGIQVEAVERDSEWPLGFPTSRWKPADTPAYPEQIRNSGYVVSAVPYLKYVLPEMPPRSPNDDLGLSTFAIPGWPEPVSFTVHALEDLSDVEVTVSDLALRKRPTSNIEHRTSNGEREGCQKDPRSAWRPRALSHTSMLDVGCSVFDVSPCTFSGPSNAGGVASRNLQPSGAPRSRGRQAAGSTVQALVRAATISRSEHPGLPGNQQAQAGSLCHEGVIPSDHIDVRCVRYLYKKRHMMSSEYLLSPNHLEPFETVSVPVGRTQQFWLTIHVPEDAVPGTYEGFVRVGPSGRAAKALRLSIEVLPVRTMEPTGLRVGMFSYRLPNHPKEKLLTSFRDMRAHGMTTTFMFHPGLVVPIRQDEAGTPRIDWDGDNHLREVFEAYEQAGFPEPLMFYAPTAIFKAAEEYGGALGTEGFARIFGQLYVQIVEEKNRRGWSDFVVAPYDEGYPYPFSETRFEQTRVCGGILKALGIPTATHSFNHPIPAAVRYEKEFYDTIDVILLTFCHPPVTVSNEYRNGEAWDPYRARLKADGKTLMFYNVDVTGVHPEAMRFGYGVALWARGADGMIDWHYQDFVSGGGYELSRRQGGVVMSFVYDAHGEFKGGPSIGWEAAREGVKDYTLLHTLRALVERAKQSTDEAVKEAAARAERDVASMLARLTFDTIDTGSQLALPGRWDSETYDENNVKILGGDYKIPNGFAYADYDRLRRVVCEHILVLKERSD